MHTFLLLQIYFFHSVNCRELLAAQGSCSTPVWNWWVYVDGRVHVHVYVYTCKYSCCSSHYCHCQYCRLEWLRTDVRVELDLSYLIVSSQYPLLTSMSVSASSNGMLYHLLWRPFPVNWCMIVIFWCALVKSYSNNNLIITSDISVTVQLPSSVNSG